MQGFMINKTKRLLKRASTRDALRRQQEQREEQMINDTKKRPSSLEQLTMQCRFPSLSSLVNFSLSANGSASSRPDADSGDIVTAMKRPLHKMHSFSATSIGLQIGLPSPSKTDGKSAQVCMQMPIGVIVDPNKSDMQNCTTNIPFTEKLPTLGETGQVNQQSRTFRPLTRAKSCYITLLYPSMQEEDIESENSDEQDQSNNLIQNQTNQSSRTDTHSGPLAQKEVVVIPNPSDKLTNPDIPEMKSQNLNDFDGLNNNLSSQDQSQLTRQNSKHDTPPSKQIGGMFKQDSSSQLAQLRSRLKCRSRYNSKGYGKPFDSITNDPQNGNDEDDEYDVELGRYINVFRRPLSPSLKELPLDAVTNETNDEHGASSSQDQGSPRSDTSHTITNKGDVSNETINVDVRGSQQELDDISCHDFRAELSSDKTLPKDQHRMKFNQLENLENVEISCNSDLAQDVNTDSNTQAGKKGFPKWRNSKRVKSSPTKQTGKGSKDTNENIKESSRRRSSFTKTIQNGKTFLSTLPPFNFRHLFQKKQFSTVPILPPIGSSKKYQIQEHKEILGKDDSKGKSFYQPKQPDKPMTSGMFRRRNRRVPSSKSNGLHAHKIPNVETSRLETSGYVSTKTMTNMSALCSHSQMGTFERIDKDKNKQNRYLIETSPYLNNSKGSKTDTRHKPSKGYATLSKPEEIETNHQIGVKENDKLLGQ